jgi:hypothetical protein
MTATSNANAKINALRLFAVLPSSTKLSRIPDS